MRRKLLEKKEEFLPLRRFALEGLYSPAYLSLLVQRKKLKARKIGRNFYTTREWFEEYLTKHARDEIRMAYRKEFSREEKNIDFNIYFNIDLFKKAIANKIFITAMVFIMVILTAWVIAMNFNSENGHVAGEEEINTADFTQINTRN